MFIMRSRSISSILVLGAISGALGTAITPAAVRPTVVAERGIFSSVSVASCSTVSGLASPEPSGAVCGELANSDGTGYIISYTSGSPYVASLGACGQICLETETCENVYFTQGSNCNLHNTRTPVANSASTYKFYDATCFSCTALQTCSIVSGFATPQPANTTCGVLAVSDGTQLQISYTSGVYTDNAVTCGTICLQTAGCTNVYFESGAYCNLHSGIPTNTASSTSVFTFYDLGCFTCQVVVYTSSSSSVSSTSSLSRRSSSSSMLASSTTSSSSAAASSTAAASSSSTSTTPTTTAPWTWTSVQTDPASYNLALTTTFTQSPQCTTGGITMMDAYGPYLWDNSVNPVPTSTVTTCYPPQFYSSVIGTLNNVNLPAFSELVCPFDWDTITYNASYIACCPNGFGLIAPNYLSNSARPYSAALCTSLIGLSQVYDVSSYNSTAYWTDMSVTATAGTIVFADAFDGFTAPATTSAVKTTSSSSKTSSSVIMSSSSASSIKSTSTSSAKTTSFSTSNPASSSSRTSSSVIISSFSTSSIKPITTLSAKTTTASSTSKPTSSSSLSPTITSTGTAVPGESNLPACGQTCFNNMLAQYSTLGCAPLDSYCLCNNVNFGYGIRDCSNGACGTAVASTVIAFGSAYCSTASATYTGPKVTSTTTTAVPGESNLPACGQTCFNNMLAQYSTLGCASIDSYCLCNNVNFGYGIRDCSNGACGTAVASTVIAFGSAYCASATATHTRSA